jgi:hypothetical protein
MTPIKKKEFNISGGGHLPNFPTQEPKKDRNATDETNAFS